MPVLQVKHPKTGKVAEIRWEEGQPRPTAEQVTSLFESRPTVSYTPPEWKPTPTMSGTIDPSRPYSVTGIVPPPDIEQQTQEAVKPVTDIVNILGAGPAGLVPGVIRGTQKFVKGVGQLGGPKLSPQALQLMQEGRAPEAVPEIGLPTGPLGVGVAPSAPSEEPGGLARGLLNMGAGAAEAALSTILGLTPTGAGFAAGNAALNALPPTEAGHRVSDVSNLLTAPASTTRLAEELGVRNPEVASNLNLLGDVAAQGGALGMLHRGVPDITGAARRFIEKQKADFARAGVIDQIKSGKITPEEGRAQLGERPAPDAEGVLGTIMPNGEKIIQAAIKIGGKVFVGNNHGEAHNAARAAGALVPGKTLADLGYQSGFTGDRGTFFPRDTPGSPLVSERLPQNAEVLADINARRLPVKPMDVRAEVAPGLPADKLNAFLQRAARGGEIPWTYDRKKGLWAGKKGEKHLGATGQPSNAFDVAGRYTADGTAVSIWNEQGDVPQQRLADALFDLVQSGKVKKDALVYWSDGTNMKIGDAIGGGQLSVKVGGEEAIKALVGIGSRMKREDLMTAGLKHRVDVKKVAENVELNRGGFTLFSDGTPATDGHSVALGADKQVVLPANATPEQVQAAASKIMTDNIGAYRRNPDLGVGGWTEGDKLYIEPVKITATPEQAAFIGKHTVQKSVADLSKIGSEDAFTELGGQDDAGAVLRNLPGDLSQRLKVLDSRWQREQDYRSVRERKSTIPYGQGGREAVSGAENIGDAMARASKYNEEVLGLPALPKDAPYAEAYGRYHDLVLEPLKESLRREREQGVPSGKDWYTTDMQKFDEAFKADHPDVTPAELKLIKIMASPISAGTPVADEVRGAITAFKWYKATGKMPEYQPEGFDPKTGYVYKTNAETGEPLGWNAYRNDAANKLRKIGEMLDENGGDAQRVVDFMESRGTLAEMQKIAPSRVNILEPGMPMRGAEGFFGPKTGPYSIDKTVTEPVGLATSTTQDTHMVRSKLGAMGLGVIKDPATGKMRPVDSTDLTPELRRQMIQMDIDMARALKEETGIELLPKQVQAVDWGIQRDFAERNREYVDTRGTNYPESYEKWKAEGGLDRLNESISRSTEGRREDANVGAVQEGAGEGEGQARPAAQGDAFEAKAGDTDFEFGAGKVAAMSITPGLEGPLGEGVKKIKDYAASLNLNNIETTKENKDAMRDEGKKLKEDYFKEFGEVLTDAQVIELAQKAAAWNKEVPASTKIEFNARMLRLRQELTQEAETLRTTGKPSEDHLRLLRVYNSNARFLGTSLQKLSVLAKGVSRSTDIEVFMNDILTRLEKENANMDEVNRRAQGINWQNEQEVAKFYREFVKPKMSELLDEYRYINMLSSPRTHIINAFSNLLQASMLAPATHAVAEGPGAAAAYYRGLGKSLAPAAKEALDVLTGKQGVRRLDIEHIPTVGATTTGNILKRGFGKVLSKYNQLGAPVTRALEASDILFRRAIEGAELETIKRKDVKQGVQTDEVNALQEAADAAAYWIFRGALDPKNETGQGKVLATIDKASSVAYKIREVPGGKYLLPFVATPMNIFKQGVEFSPVGFTTMIGAKNKRIQFSKALIGTAVFGGTLAAVLNTDSTWDEPTDESERAQWRQEGKIPFAIKVGDTYVSYSKLGPLAYPMAMAAAYKHFVAQGDDDSATNILNALGGTVQFFSDQSYVQGLRDLTNFLSGKFGKVEGIGRNVGRQMIPLTAFQTWVNGVADGTRRAPENFFEKMTTSIPGLSGEQSPRYGALGQEQKKPLPTANLFSPLALSAESTDPLVVQLRDKGVKVGLPNRTVFGQKLAEGQYQRYVKTAGQEISRQLVPLVNSAAFKAMSLGEAQQEINRIRNEVFDETSQKMFPAAYQIWMSEREM